MTIKIKLKQIKTAVYWLIFAALVIISGLTALSSLKIPGFPRLFVVQSGSMEPQINVGSVVAVSPQNEYKVGEVITFKDPANSKNTVTHRITKVDVTSTGGLYTTKGDANNSADVALTPQTQVIGKMLLALPKVGYLINFTKTQQGLILLIVIPSVLIIYTEILNIKNEVVKLILKKRQKS